MARVSLCVLEAEVSEPFKGSDSEAESHMVRRMPKVGVFEEQLENQGAREREVTQRSKRKAGPRLCRSLDFNSKCNGKLLEDINQGNYMI